MNRYGYITSVLFAAGLLAGCNGAGRGTTMSLGRVNYDKAFKAAKSVMGQYFSVASADADAGLIESRPKPIDAKPAGIFRNPAARRIATLKLFREGGEVFARLAVEIQRQEAAACYQLQMAASGYNTVPDKTPAEIDAATTAEQNEAWQTQKFDHTLEYTILRDLRKKLHKGK